MAFSYANIQNSRPLSRVQLLNRFHQLKLKQVGKSAIQFTVYPQIETVFIFLHWACPAWSHNPETKHRDVLTRSNRDCEQTADRKDHLNYKISVI